MYRILLPILLITPLLAKEYTYLLRDERGNVSVGLNDNRMPYTILSTSYDLLQTRTDEFYCGIGSLLVFPLLSISSGWKHYFSVNKSSIYFSLSYVYFQGTLHTNQLGDISLEQYISTISFGYEYETFSGQLLQLGMTNYHLPFLKMEVPIHFK